MSQKKSKGINKLTLGMLLLAVGGLFLGAAVGYFLTNTYLNNKVLKDMKEDGYVLTIDATATSEDIVAGKSAYVNGQLVYGIQEVLDTSDATAMAQHIRKGKTAYINGELVIGDMEEISGNKYKPSTEAVSIKGNGYLTSDITIVGEKNLVPKNIFQGQALWNVYGVGQEKVVPVVPVTPDPVEGGGGE